MCFAVSINVLPRSLMFSSNYKCFAVADMGHRTSECVLCIFDENIKPTHEPAPIFECSKAFESI
jgi:hypothetical protein